MTDHANGMERHAQDRRHAQQRDREYCGAIGLISHQRTVFNVAIRTIVLTGQRPAGSWGRLQGLLDYGVGGGIVADSLPVAEYRETMDKAEILRRVLQVRQPDRAAVTR